MDKIPVEIFYQIFSFMYFIDIFNFSRVNKFICDAGKEYHIILHPSKYFLLSKTIYRNIVEKNYLLSDCNIIYPYINIKIKDKYSIIFENEEKLKDGIYYFSNNYYNSAMLLNEYIYNKYLIINKFKNKFHITCYKKYFNNEIISKECITNIDNLNLYINSNDKLFRLY